MRGRWGRGAWGCECVCVIFPGELCGNRKHCRLSSLKGREGAIVNQTSIGTVSKATSGKLLTDVCGAHIGFSERTDIILN